MKTIKEIKKHERQNERSNIKLTGVSQEDRNNRDNREMEEGTILRKKMTKIFPELMKSMNPQTQKAK